MKHLQLTFIALWAAVALWAALCESGLVAEGFMGTSPIVTYFLNLVCVITAVGGTWLACRLLRFRLVKAELADNAPKALRKWNGIRLAILALAIVPSAVCYYGVLSSTALYSLLIALTGSLLCWPRANV